MKRLSQLRDLKQYLEDALKNLKKDTPSYNVCKSILYRVNKILNEEPINE